MKRADKILRLAKENKIAINNGVGMQTLCSDILKSRSAMMSSDENHIMEEADFPVSLPAVENNDGCVLTSLNQEEISADVNSHQGPNPQYVRAIEPTTENNNCEPETETFHTFTLSHESDQTTILSPMPFLGDLQLVEQNDKPVFDKEIYSQLCQPNGNSKCLTVELSNAQNDNNDGCIPIETVYENNGSDIIITEASLLGEVDLFSTSEVESAVMLLDLQPLAEPEENILMQCCSSAGTEKDDLVAMLSTNPAKEEMVIETAEEQPVENSENENNMNIEMNMDLTKKGNPRKRKAKQTKESRDIRLRKTVKQNKEKHQLKPPCKDSCKKVCKKKISAVRRETLNKEFWNQDWTARRLFVLHTTTKNDVKRRTKNVLSGDSRRNKTINFCLKDESGKVHQVCKTFYLSTLGYTSHNDTIIKLVSNASNISVEKDKRGLHPKHKKVDRQSINNHIDKYHPCVSHYRREHAPNKLYLPSDISIKIMHSDFIKNNPDVPCSYELYRNVVVKERNISFAHLGHEECEICESHKLHNSLHSKENLDPECENCKAWDSHIKRAKIARQMYRDDAQNAIGSSTLYFSADLQKVIMLPRLEMFKSVIFTQRIIAFNESFVPLGKNSKEKPFAVVWHEAMAGRKKEELISAFFQFFVHYRDQKHIVLWLDNCTGQNKNWALFSFLVYLINSDHVSTETICLKYFEPGHTFMSADSFHHQVETALKKQKKTYDFQDFQNAVSSANSGKVTLKSMTFSDFYHWKDHSSKATLNRLRPKVYVSNLVQVVAKRGLLHLEYKNDFLDSDLKQLTFLKVSIIKKKHQMADPERYSVSRGIPVSKRDNLLKNLASIIPQDRLRFWENIPVSDASNDLIESFD